MRHSRWITTSYTYVLIVFQLTLTQVAGVVPSTITATTTTVTGMSSIVPEFVTDSSAQTGASPPNISFLDMPLASSEGKLKFMTYIKHI